MVKEYTTHLVYDPITYEFMNVKYPLFKDETFTHDQSIAVAQAFTDFIWELMENEN